MTPEQVDDAAQALRVRLWGVIEEDYPAGKAKSALEGREFLAIVVKALAGLTGMLLAPLPGTDEVALRVLFDVCLDRHYNETLEQIEHDQEEAEAQEAAAEAQASKPS